MQYRASTPDEYIGKLENDWRKKKLQQLRIMILESDSSLIEGIEHNMLSYGNTTESVFHLNAQKHYVSLYVGNVEAIPDGRRLLQNFDVGKGCIRVKKTNELPNPNLRKFLKAVVKAWIAGEDVGC